MNYQPDELFHSTAPYYVRFRAAYPQQFFTYLAQRFALDGTQRVLDLGSGPGPIAIPLANHVREIIAVDPEPGMLAAGRALAARQGITNIDWRLGDSNHLTDLNLGRLDLVTLGASFHWMDQPGVLRTLDRLITLNGGIVITATRPQ